MLQTDRDGDIATLAVAIVALAKVLAALNLSEAQRGVVEKVIELPTVLSVPVKV